MTVLVAQLTTLLNHYAPWFLPFFLIGVCFTWGFVDGSIARPHYAHPFREMSTYGKKRKGGKRRLGCLATALMAFVLFFAPVLPVIRTLLPLLLSYAVGRIAAVAFSNKKINQQFVLPALLGTLCALFFN